MKTFLAVSRDGWTGQLQLSIEDENGGFRLKGPKFNGSSETLLKAEIDERSAERIRQYLDQAFPIKTKRRSK